MVRARHDEKRRARGGEVMKARITSQHSPEEVAQWLINGIEGTRFTAAVEVISSQSLKIVDVKLRQTKPYCGYHPAACELAGSHRRRAYLEGADWVEFNDLVNDVLDLHSASAHVYSIVCVIRQGSKRRVRYGAEYGRFGGNATWERIGETGDYHDYRGTVAPVSDFPEGTPGNYSKIRYACVG
jgi:hypothetical protein